MINAPFTNLTMRRLAMRSVAATATLMIGLLVTIHAHAQVAAPFIGTWKATWQTDKKSYEAVMTVTEAGGTWQTATQDRKNPCVGREVPMKVESNTQTEVQFQLQFSEVIRGCQNATVALKASPDGTVTGTRGKYELVLLRK